MAKMMSGEPPALSGDSEIEREADRRFRRAQNSQSEWRVQAGEFYKTYGGNPWPDGTREILEDEGRPAVTFNYSLSYVNAVLGQDIADRKEAHFEGQDGDLRDSAAGEVLTKVIRNIYVKCNAYREETEAQQDQLVTGYGWTEAYLDTTRFPVWPRISSVPYEEMYWDPDSKKNNLRDARWVMRRKRWALEDAIAKWPEKAEELRTLAKTRGDRAGGVFPKKARASNYAERGLGIEDPNLEEDHLYIFDYQYKKPSAFVVFVDPETGERKKLLKSEFKEWKKGIDAVLDEEGIPKFAKVQAVDMQLEGVFRCFMAGSVQGGMTLLDGPLPLETEMFTYRCATAYRGKSASGKVQFFGLMSLIYEPQLWTAKALSAAIEHIARNPKGGGGFIDAELLQDPSDFKKHGSKMGYWALTNPGMPIKDKIVERTAPPFHQAYERLFDIAERAMGQLTTISDYFKGTSQQERSNVLVSNLQGQTMLVLNPLIDPMNQLRIENALLIGKLTQLHVSPNDFNRLAGPLEIVGITHTVATTPEGVELYQDGEPVLQPLPLTDEVGQPIIDESTGQPAMVTPFDLIADKDLFEFDIVIDLGPASVTQKQNVWNNITNNAFIQETVKSNPSLSTRLMPIFAKNMPGVSTEEARKLSEDINEELRMQKVQGTLQGVMEAIPQLPPEAVQQILMTAQSVVMSYQQQAQQAAGGAAPPDAPVQ